MSLVRVTWNVESTPNPKTSGARAGTTVAPLGLMRLKQNDVTNMKPMISSAKLYGNVSGTTINGGASGRANNLCSQNADW